MRFGRSNTPHKNGDATHQRALHDPVKLPAVERRVLTAADEMSESLFGLRIEEHEIGIGSGGKCSAGQFKNLRGDVRHSLNEFVERKNSRLDQFGHEKRKHGFKADESERSRIKILRLFRLRMRRVIGGD